MGESSRRSQARGHLLTALAILLEFLAVTLGPLWLAWGAALFVWLAYDVYSKGWFSRSVRNTSRVLSAIVLAVLTLGLVAFVDRPKNPPVIPLPGPAPIESPTPSTPIVVTVPVSMATQGTLWAFNKSTGLVYPIDGIILFRVVNTSASLQEVTGLAIEAKSAEGWIELKPVHLNELYFGDLKSPIRAELASPDFYSALAGTLLEPGKAVRATGLYQYPGREPGDPTSLRLTVTDSAGRVSVTEVSGAMTHGGFERFGIKITGPRKDLSGFKQER